MKKARTKLIPILVIIGIAIINIAHGQPVTGIGTTNLVPVWQSGSGSILSDSQINDDPGSGDVRIGTGSVDLSGATQKFKIATSPVLWHNNIPSNIYVGVNAGNASTASGTYTNINNTLIGYSTGNNITSASDNTCVGSNAGYNITVSKWNVCVGSSAGFSLQTGNSADNTFVGYKSGYYTSGSSVALSIVAGTHNSFFGDETGLNNITGNENTAVGAHADYGFANLKNATVIGAFAKSH